MCHRCTVGGGNFRRRESKKRLLPRQNASPSEGAAEDYMPPKHRPSRSLQKVADIAIDDGCIEDDEQLVSKEPHSMLDLLPPFKTTDNMTDDHCSEGDKQLSSGRLADDVILDTKPHDGLKSYDSESPATALASDDDCTSPSHHPSRRSRLETADTVKDDHCIEDDKQLLNKHKWTCDVISNIQTPGSLESDNDAEYDSKWPTRAEADDNRISLKDHQRRTSQLKTANTVEDGHCSEGDKQVVSNGKSTDDVIPSIETPGDDDTAYGSRSVGKEPFKNNSSLTIDVIPSVEPNASLKSDDNTACNFKSPSLTLDNRAVAKQPRVVPHQPSPTGHDPSKQQKSLFETERCGISVFVYTGDLQHEKVDAVVNPANIHLVHGGGAAKAIATAAGQQLQAECAQYIGQKGPLRVTEVMHTSAGNLRPNVLYVIHAAGPDATTYPNQSKLHVDLRSTFYNCLRYANDVLKIKSMAVPAIGAGLYNTCLFMLMTVYTDTESVVVNV